MQFKSQKAYLTINQSSRVIILDDQKTTLKDILTSANVGLKPGVITRVRLQRDGNEYPMKLRSIFKEDAPEINIAARDHIFVEDSSANVVSSTSIVGHDGRIVLAGVGSILVAGLSLSEVQAKITSLIEKIPGSQNAFQIEIKEYFSKKAILNIPGKAGGIIPITKKAIALDQILIENGLSIDGDSITNISLLRQSTVYTFTLEDLFKPSARPIFIQQMIGSLPKF